MEIEIPVQKRRRLSSFQVIILGFSSVILMGTALLMLPLATRDGAATPFHEAVFTSASAVCVTGLVLHDTAAYWSCFGQGVILLLIQTGGMGVVTVAASFAMLAGRRLAYMTAETLSASSVFTKGAFRWIMPGAARTWTDRNCT